MHTVLGRGKSISKVNLIFDETLATAGKTLEAVRKYLK
jgi:hypothetical protein